MTFKELIGKAAKTIKQYKEDEPIRRQERLNKLLEEEKRLKEIQKVQAVEERVNKLRQKTNKDTGLGLSLGNDKKKKEEPFRW